MTNPITPTPSAPIPAVAAQGGAPTAATARQDVTGSGKAVPSQEASRAAEAPRQSEPAVQQATRDIAEYIQTVNRSLQISVDEELGSTVITVIDKETDKVVRQIPSEEIVALARFVNQQRAELAGSELPVRGLLIDREG